MDRAKMKVVFAISPQRAKAARAGGGTTTRKYWNRVGIAFVNRDGSLNVKLEALPVSGELHIRDYVPDQDTLTDTPTQTSTGDAGLAA